MIDNKAASVIEPIFSSPTRECGCLEVKGHVCEVTETRYLFCRACDKLHAGFESATQSYTLTYTYNYAQRDIFCGKKR